jgi:hypothetical protein
VLAPQLLLLVLLLCGPATALIPCPDNAGCVIINTDGVGNDVPAFFLQVRFCSRHRSRQVVLAFVSAADGICPAPELWLISACYCHGSGCTALCVEVQLTCLVNHCQQALSDPTVTEVVLASARFRLKVAAWIKYTAKNPLILQRNVTVRSRNVACSCSNARTPAELRWHHRLHLYSNSRQRCAAQNHQPASLVGHLCQLTPHILVVAVVTMGANNPHSKAVCYHIALIVEPSGALYF